MPETEALRLYLSTNAYWAEWSTLAVFVGLLGDIFVIIWFDLRDPDKSRREIWLAGIASVVIAAGVLGEWRFGHRATDASSQIQAVLEKQTGDANERAANAVRQAAIAQAAVKEAESHLAEANARSAEANARAAEANKVAEQERVARLKLEVKLAPRILTSAQEGRIADRLPPLLGWVTVGQTSTEDELRTLGDQLSASLKAAHWNVVRNGLTIGLDRFQGVEVFSASPTPPSLPLL